jgi:hypothetical protein
LYTGTVLKQSNGKAFKEECKTGMGGSPRDSDGLYSTRFALTPGDARYNDGFKLRGIKMPPTLFRGLVIGFTAVSTLMAEHFISYKTEVNLYLLTRDG